MPKIPLFLVTGFLGSGKTTFLREIIRQHGDKTSIGIIQNEFAPANVDGEILKHESENSFHILEINRGSVFCVCLLNDFVSSTIKFIETYSPDVLFIEASGLSDPIAIAQITSRSKLNEYVYLAKTWCLIDATNYLAQTQHSTQLRHQIQVADMLIINKTDLAPDIEKIRKSLQKINILANIEKTSFARLNKIELQKPFGPLPAAFQAGMNPGVPGGSEPPDIEFMVYTSHKPVMIDNLPELFYASEKTGLIVRAKGFIITPDRNRIFNMQYVSGCFTLKKLHNTHQRMQSEVIFLGYKLNEKAIISMFEVNASID